MKVSVVVITYNHERYLAQALESVLAQEANFDFEVLVTEDCSTDHTRDVLHDFVRRHPERIRLFFSERNLGTAEVGLRAFRAARGEYLALLEGDDYWTSPHKLQRQADFLDAHPDHALCHHNVEVRHEGGSRPPYLFNAPDHPRSTTLEDLLVTNYIQTCSVMMRNRSFADLPTWFDEVDPQDWALHVLNAQHGRIGYLDDVMAVYRVHGASFWSSRSRATHMDSTACFYEKVNEHLGFRHDAMLRTLISRCRIAASLERSALPPEVTVVVLGDSDGSPAHEQGRRAWSFPQKPGGEFAGRYPESTGAAARELEALREGGGEFLLVPGEAFGWLERNPDFWRYLDDRHRCIWGDEHCLLYELCERPRIAVREVRFATADTELLHGFHIDLPRAGSEPDPAEMPFEGWVVGRGSPAVAVEVLRGHCLLQRVPVAIPRPDLAAALPRAAGLEAAGFRATLNVPEPRPRATLALDAVLCDEGRVRFATIEAGGIHTSDEAATLYVRVDAVEPVRRGEYEAQAGPLLGWHLDHPATGSSVEVAVFDIAGWVVGRSGPVAAVEVRHEGVLLQRAAVAAHRPDVARTFPDTPHALGSGFHARIDLSAPLGVSLRVDVLFESGGRVPLGSIGLVSVAAERVGTGAPRRCGRQSRAPDGLPLPPERLMYLVAGTHRARWFLEGGQEATATIRRALEAIGRPFESFAQLLDWGCGVGRVIRHFHGQPGPALTGCDYNPELVEWSRQAYPLARFECNDLLPPLPFEHESFDLVYGLSVLTHLPHELMAAWMAELARVVRPGGVALLSTHGAHYLPMLSAEEQARFHAGQLVVWGSEGAGSNDCVTYCSESYVRKELAARHGFEVVHFVAEGAWGNPFQDLYLLQRLPQPDETAAPRTRRESPA